MKRIPAILMAVAMSALAVAVILAVTGGSDEATATVRVPAGDTATCPSGQTVERISVTGPGRDTDTTTLGPAIADKLDASQVTVVVSADTFKAETDGRSVTLNRVGSGELTLEVVCR